METVPQTFTQAHYIMELVKREGKAVMYKAKHDNYWEVHAVKVAKAERKFGKDYPERELLAGNEEFGKRAWAVCSLERAEARFEEVLEWERPKSDEGKDLA